LATIPILTANQKPADYETIKSSLATAQTDLKTANETITSLSNNQKPADYDNLKKIETDYNKLGLE